MKKCVFLLVLIAFLQAVPVYGVDSCNAIIGRHLQYTSSATNTPTVKFNGLDANGDVVLTKPSGLLSGWNSTNRSEGHPYSPQGDPRWPIAIFGINLAAKLGFRIVESHNDLIYAPGARKFAARIYQMNRNLIASGFEPVAFLPVKAGFLSSQQSIELALKKDREIVMQFPYDDDDAALTPHEVSYHLGAIVYPEKFIKRAFEITRLTRDFTSLLSERDPALATIINDHLLVVRSLELDAGTGNVSMMLGQLRLQHKMASYRDILQFTNEAIIDQIGQYLDLFSRPKMQPIDALLMRINFLTGVNVDDLLTESSAKHSFYSLLPDEEDKLIVLPSAQQEALREILADYVEAYKQSGSFKKYKIYPSFMTYTEDFIRGLDSRVEQMANALPAVDSGLPLTHRTVAPQSGARRQIAHQRIAR